MNENTEQSLADELIDLSAYAPTKLVKNDVENSSGKAVGFFSFFIALGLHGIFFWWIYAEFELSGKSVPDELVTLLEFLEPEAKPQLIEMLPEMIITKPISAEPVRRIDASSTSNKPVPIETKQNNPDKTLGLYDDSGRIKLPVDFIETLDEKNLASRTFDFRNPDLELAGTFLKRPPAIDFDPTQFEGAWQPDQDILTKLLTTAVEKTTKEIKIPVPGNPTVKLVCKVSVLALGGGCGFVPNGGYGRVIPDNENDPATLSPDEDKQCQAWWEKISNTRSQREWMKTKELYELTCKKPQAKVKK